MVPAALLARLAWDTEDVDGRFDQRERNAIGGVVHVVNIVSLVRRAPSSLRAIDCSPLVAAERTISVPPPPLFQNLELYFPLGRAH